MQQVADFQSPTDPHKGFLLEGDVKDIGLTLWKAVVRVGCHDLGGTKALEYIGSRFLMQNRVLVPLFNRTLAFNSSSKELRAADMVPPSTLSLTTTL